MEAEHEKPMTKVKDLTPDAKQTNVLVKVVNVGERRTIDSRYGGSRQLAEAVVGDETGTVILSLWEDQIEQVSPDEVLFVDNGYVSLVRGHMRLNVGKYGALRKSEQEIPEVNSTVDVSAQEFERPHRYERPRGGGGGYGGRGRGGRGGRDRDTGRDRGRRRF